eukprot:1301341-Rhodomonas_salina.6
MNRCVSTGHPRRLVPRCTGHRAFFFSQQTCGVDVLVLEDADKHGEGGGDGTDVAAAAGEEGELAALAHGGVRVEGQQLHLLQARPHQLRPRQFPLKRQRDDDGGVVEEDTVELCRRIVECCIVRMTCSCTAYECRSLVRRRVGA